MQELGLRNGRTQPVFFARRSFLSICCLALMLAGCGMGAGSGADKEHAKGLQGIGDDRAGSADGKADEFTADGKRIYLGEVFAPNVNETDFFDVCSAVPESLLKEYQLTLVPEEMQHPSHNPAKGVSMCSYYMGEPGANAIGVLSFMSTLQSNEVREAFATEEFFQFHDDALPDARYFGDPVDFESMCEVSVDTSRGRIAVSGSYGIFNTELEKQCRQNAGILHQIIAISKGDQ